MRLWIEAEVLRLTNIRAAPAPQVGTPGPEGSIGKAASPSSTRTIMRVHASTCSGAEGMLYTTLPDDRARSTTMAWASPQQAFLRMRANSIEGGTTEVMKNILGERVLGLPGDVRADKDARGARCPAAEGFAVGARPHQFCRPSAMAARCGVSLALTNCRGPSVLASTRLMLV